MIELKPIISSPLKLFKCLHCSMKNLISSLYIHICNIEY